VNRAHKGKVVRWLELVAVFVALPLLHASGRIPGHVLVWLAGLAGVCLVLLLADTRFDRRRLGNRPGWRREVGRTLLLFSLVAVFVSAAVWWAAPKAFLGLPRSRPELWLLVMVLYPLLSAYPQELVWRTFFFHRYRALFPRPQLMVAASAIAFGLMHVVFGNWVAVAMSGAGGWLFAATYSRSKSTLSAWWEHTLYGWLVFTVGLGRYFVF